MVYPDPERALPWGRVWCRGQGTWAQCQAKPEEWTPSTPATLWASGVLGGLGWGPRVESGLNFRVWTVFSPPGMLSWESSPFLALGQAHRPVLESAFCGLVLYVWRSGVRAPWKGWQPSRDLRRTEAHASRFGMELFWASVSPHDVMPWAQLRPPSGPVSSLCVLGPLATLFALWTAGLLSALALCLLLAETPMLRPPFCLQGQLLCCPCPSQGEGHEAAGAEEEVCGRAAACLAFCPARHVPPVSAYPQHHLSVS